MIFPTNRAMRRFLTARKRPKQEDLDISDPDESTLPFFTCEGASPESWTSPYQPKPDSSLEPAKKKKEKPPLIFGFRFEAQVFDKVQTDLRPP